MEFFDKLMGEITRPIRLVYPDGTTKIEQTTEDQARERIRLMSTYGTGSRSELSRARRLFARALFAERLYKEYLAKFLEQDSEIDAMYGVSHAPAILETVPAIHGVRGRSSDLFVFRRTQEGLLPILGIDVTISRKVAMIKDKNKKLPGMNLDVNIPVVRVPVGDLFLYINDTDQVKLKKFITHNFRKRLRQGDYDPFTDMSSYTADRVVNAASTFLCSGIRELRTIWNGQAEEVPVEIRNKLALAYSIFGCENSTTNEDESN